MKNILGLGCGWLTQCKHCGKEFRTVSHKQVYCCSECSFLDRIKKLDNGCWEWQGNCNNQGYGVLRVNHKMKMAHRHSYEYFKGEIPKGVLVCHTCDNPKCVNPDHLFLGTHYDNNHDRSLKGRSGKRVYSESERKRYSLMFRGENQTNAKLTEKEAIEIYSNKTLSNGQLAKKYGVSKSLVKNIRHKRAWRHIHEL